MTVYVDIELYSDTDSGQISSEFHCQGHWEHNIMSEIFEPSTPNRIYFCSREGCVILKILWYSDIRIDYCHKLIPIKAAIFKI